MGFAVELHNTFSIKLRYLLWLHGTGKAFVPLRLRSPTFGTHAAD